MPEWGDDPNKWVIKKSSFGRGWCLFPPNDGEMWIHHTFEAAVSVMTACSKPQD